MHGAKIKIVYLNVSLCYTPRSKFVAYGPDSCS